MSRRASQSGSTESTSSLSWTRFRHKQEKHYTRHSHAIQRRDSEAPDELVFLDDHEGRLHLRDLRHTEELRADLRVRRVECGLVPTTSTLLILTSAARTEPRMVSCSSLGFSTTRRVTSTRALDGIMDQSSCTWSRGTRTSRASST